jgi:hypothetical protein
MLSLSAFVIVLLLIAVAGLATFTGAVVVVVLGVVVLGRRSNKSRTSVRRQTGRR